MISTNYARLYAVLTLLFIFLFPTTNFGQNEEIPVTTESQEASSYFMEGRYKYENIQYASAAALFDEAILTDQNFAMAYLYRARCGGGYNIVQKNMQKAESLIDRVSDGEKHLILFQKALLEADHIAQKENAMKLMELFPNDKRMHYNVGLYYDFIHDPATALMHYFKALNIDEKYAAAYNKIGYDFIDLGFMQSAGEAFKKYIALIPDSPNPYDSYAELLLKLGKYQESIEQYQLANQKDRLFTQALAGVGHNYVFLADFETAREYYHRQHEKATRTNEKLEALLWIAVSYIHEGNIDEALHTLKLRQTFAENAGLLPDIIDTQNLLGILSTETGKYNDAEKYFNDSEKLIEKSDLEKPVKDSYIVQFHINKCLLLVKSNKLELAKHAMAICDKNVVKRNNLAEIKRMNLVLGLFNLYSGKPKEALNYFNNADTENPYTWYYIAEAYNKLGYTENAEAFKDRIKYWNQNSFDFALVRNKME